MARILIVDDEANLRATLGRALRAEGYATAEAGDGVAAFEAIEKGEADAVLLDLEMPRLDGLGLLERLAERRIEIPTVVLTAHGSVDRAVRAVRLGARDFVEKPPSLERILVALRNALEARGLEEENRRLAEAAGVSSGILGESKAIAALEEAIARIAPAEATVLVLGENGTGKELVARALHAGSPRARKPFVTVNCAAIPETLFESELFGHARGAFTGATEARRGKFQQADGGTLFLDEIGEVPSGVQPKLLRAIETGEVERVGGGGGERVSVRIVAATNRDLAAEVREGRFREDLFYRLNVVPIVVPSLAERREDVPLLAAHFLEAACRRNRVPGKKLAPAALAILRGHAWPGNVRELRNAMERVAILVPGGTINAEDLDFLSGAPGREGALDGAPPGPFSLAEETARRERALVLEVLERTGWKMTRAAEELGLERSHLYKKMKALGIERPPES